MRMAFPIPNCSGMKDSIPINPAMVAYIPIFRYMTIKAVGRTNQMLSSTYAGTIYCGEGEVRLGG